MDGEISIPRNIQTDRIAGPVAKRERRGGNPRRFEEQLSREKKSAETHDHSPDPQQPPEAADPPAPPESAPAPAAEDNGLLDFEA